MSRNFVEIYEFISGEIVTFQGLVFRHVTVTSQLASLCLKLPSNSTACSTVYVNIKGKTKACVTGPLCVNKRLSKQS